MVTFRQVQHSVILLALWFMSHSVVSAQNTSWIDTAVLSVADTIDFYVVPTLAVAAIAIFLWGVAQMISAMGNGSIIGDAKKSSGQLALENGKKHMVWGVIGLFIFLAVWGIVALVTEFFGVSPTVGVVPSGFCVGAACP